MSRTDGRMVKKLEVDNEMIDRGSSKSLLSSGHLFCLL